MEEVKEKTLYYRAIRYYSDGTRFISKGNKVIYDYPDSNLPESEFIKTEICDIYIDYFSTKENLDKACMGMQACFFERENLTINPYRECEE